MGRDSEALLTLAEHLWVFQARQSRGSYAKELLVWILTLGILDTVMELIAEMVDSERLDWVFENVLAPMVLAIGVMWLLALTVRRLHDVGLSGGWVVSYLLPPFSVLMPLGLLFFKGQGQGAPYPRID